MTNTLINLRKFHAEEVRHYKLILSISGSVYSASGAGVIAETERLIEMHQDAVLTLTDAINMCDEYKRKCFKDYIDRPFNSGDKND